MSAVLSAVVVVDIGGNGLNGTGPAAYGRGGTPSAGGAGGPRGGDPGGFLYGGDGMSSNGGPGGLLKVAVAVDQVGMVAVVLVTMNVVGMKQWRRWRF